MSHPKSGASLIARGVAFSYPYHADILKDVSADIVGGSFLAILGMNGSGKSTLLACLNDILAPKRGVVMLNGVPISQVKRTDRAQQMALVAQHSHAARVTVYDALLLGRRPYLSSRVSEEDHAVVQEVIDQMGMGQLALRYVDELSGGEYQKVMIARAFVQRTDVLLLDEPTNNLDLANQVEVMRLVRNAVDTRGLAAAAVMHDLNLSLRFCDRFLMIKDGVVAAYGGREVMTTEMIEDVYGVTCDVITHNGYPVMIPR